MSEHQQQPDGPKSSLGGAEKAPPAETTKVLQPPPPTPPPPFGGEQRKPEDDGPKPGDDLPEGAPDGLKEAAGGKLDEGNGDEQSRAEAAAKERGALDFMLSNPTPAKYKVEAMVDTPEGLAKLIFHMHQLDGSVIEKLEEEHSEGIGPFAKVDRQRLNAAKIAKACDSMEDANGKTLEPTDAGFIGDAIDPAIAFERMFKMQAGVADSISAEIDRMAGMTRDRVAVAEREMTNAVGN